MEEEYNQNSIFIKEYNQNGIFIFITGNPETGSDK